MPRAKSQIGNRGGRRKGAGRKRELTLSDRRKIASDYFARKQKIREATSGGLAQAAPQGYHSRTDGQIRCDVSDGCAVP